jgi:hypothetical protein
MKFYLFPKKAGHIDAGEWRKPVFVASFHWGGATRSIGVPYAGEDMPTGQEFVDAIRQWEGLYGSIGVSDGEIMENATTAK